MLRVNEWTVWGSPPCLLRTLVTAPEHPSQVISTSNSCLCHRRMTQDHDYSVTSPNPSHLSLTINCTASILVIRRVRRAFDATNHQLIHSDAAATSKAQRLFHTELLNTNMAASVPRWSSDLTDQADAHQETLSKRQHVTITESVHNFEVT